MNASRLPRGLKFTALGVLAAVVTGTALWLAAGEERAPEVDPALRDAVARAIDDYFERGPGLGTTGGLLRRLHPEADVRWFCSVEVIEAEQRVTGRPTAGVMTSCTEFASVDGTLLEGTAFGNAPMRVALVVTDGALTVRQVEQVSDGAGFRAGVERLFSEAGAREVFRRRGQGPGSPSPLDQARQAFGLPASVRPQKA